MKEIDTVFVVGSTNQDIVVMLNRRPEVGETVFGNELKYFQGGKGANQAIACHKIGAKTKFISAIGDDAFGKSLSNELNSINLDSDLHIKSFTSTGVAIINVDTKGDNSIIVVSGANNALDMDDIKITPKKDDILLLQNELNPNMLPSLLDYAKSNNMITMFNSAPAVSVINLLDKIDYLIVNEHELDISLNIKSEINLDNINDYIQYIEKVSLDFSLNLIVTIGSKGVIAVINHNTYYFQGHKVDVMDTTGAGDCFSGTFASCIAQGITVKKALEYSNLAASISIQKLGASSSYPDKYSILK